MRRFSLLLVALVGLTFIAQSCKNKIEGEQAQVGEAGEVATLTGEKFTVDAPSSILNWNASKVTGTHNGTINIADGAFYLADGGISSGSFNIDMKSIVVSDLQPGKGKEDLEGHLKGLASEGADDFFNTNAHPMAKYEITKTTSLANDSLATHLVYGNLTIKGVTKEVSFKAKVNVDGNNISVSTPQFLINRTDFGIKYGSGTFFENLGDKAINDEFGLAINLKATKG